MLTEVYRFVRPVICSGTITLIVVGCNQPTSAPVVSGTPAAPGTQTIPGSSVPGTLPGQPPQASTAASPAAGPAAAANSTGSTANRTQYEQSLAQASLEKAYEEIKRKFGPQRTAIVVVNNVPGPVAEADHYLERKIFKAAWSDYADGQERARQETEANREAAKQKALAEHEKQWGGFGPMTVWYRYQPVHSDVPYPEVRGGQFTTGQHVYYVGPVLDVAAFAGRIKVGDITGIDLNSRTVTIQSFVPTPIPDVDEEELYIQHGKESVLTVEVTGAEGEPDRVTFFLENQIREMEGGKTFTVVGPRSKGPGRYRLVVAPVKDIEAFASGISWGSIAGLDRDNRQLTLAAKLPADLPPRPTAAELAEQRRLERLGDEAPKPNESEIDWAIRVLKKGDSPHTAAKVLKALSTMHLDTGRLNEVSEALVKFATSSDWAWHVSEDLIHAMEVWSTRETNRFLIRQLGEFSWDKKLLLAALAKNPSEEGARAVATLMTDRTHALDASAALRDMGPVAEETVLKLAQDRFPSMRVEAYDIMRTIGTEKGLAKLKGLVAKEKDRDAREALRSAIADLEERLSTGEAATKNDSTQSSQKK
jgi:hypothetical protein